MTDTKYDDDRLTPEVLDAISAQLRKDALPKQSYNDAWRERLEMLLMQVIDHFDDGNDVIVQAKLADQFTRLFEKMRDNVGAAGTRKKWERRDAVRADVGIEITGNRIDDIDRDIERLRSQYWILNQSYQVCRYRVRPRTISQCGVNFGEYTPLSELPKVKRMQARKGQLTMETYEANKDDFWEFARETGLIDMGDPESHAD